MPTYKKRDQGVNSALPQQFHFFNNKRPLTLTVFFFNTNPRGLCPRLKLLKESQLY